METEMEMEPERPKKPMDSYQPMTGNQMAVSSSRERPIFQFFLTLPAFPCLPLPPFRQLLTAFRTNPAEAESYQIAEIYARCSEGHKGGGILAGSLAYLSCKFLFVDAPLVP